MGFKTKALHETNGLRHRSQICVFSGLVIGWWSKLRALYIRTQLKVEYPRGAVKYEVDTGVRPALQQAGAFGESTGSKNEGSLGESMIFGIQWEKNTKICGVIGLEPKVHNKVGSLGGT